MRYFYLLAFGFLCMSFTNPEDSSTKTKGFKSWDGKSLSFDDILNKYKGKVIYIDFWAGWCGPCKRELPHSDRLHSEFHDDEIVFLYFSADYNIKSWKKHVANLRIKGDHYWLDSSARKQMGKKFNLSLIPHFMIVDKSGKLYSTDAPRPSEAKARTILKELASN